MARVSKIKLIHKAATQGDSPVAKPPGLRQRGGSWEMRVRVPERLKPIIQKREIVKSLGGVSARDASRLGWIKRAEIERQFESAEVQLGLAEAILPASEAPDAASEAQLIELAKRYLRELEASAVPIPLDPDARAELREAFIDEIYNMGREAALEDATLQQLAQDLAGRVKLPLPSRKPKSLIHRATQEAYLEHASRQLERLNGRLVSTIDPVFAGVDAKHGGEAAGLTLADAVNEYIDAPERSANSVSSKKMDRSRLGAMRDILGGGRDVASITKADIRHYRDQLIQLPANFTKRYRDMSPEEAILAGQKDGAPTLSPTSIKRDIQSVRSFFAWLEKQDYIERNPALHVEGPRTPKKSSRRPFTSEEMQALLSATAVSQSGGKDWKYWCTRIAMLQGFRLTEPLGLQVRDLEKQGEIWVFRLRPNEFRSLKTEETARDVPVHPRLLELGILALRDGKEPSELLIPDTPKSKGMAFNAAQKQLGRIVRKDVSDDPDLTFHSLRHSFRDAMRDAGFPRSVEERLGGWKASSGDVMDGYGKGHRMAVLEQWISKISYDGVEIH